MIDFTERQVLQFIPMFVGLVFLATGFLMLKYPPKKINYFYGYRKPTSMRNQKNWNFSQIFSSKILISISLLLISISLIVLILNFDIVDKPYYMVTIVVTTIIYAIIKTELAIMQLNK